MTGIVMIEHAWKQYQRGLRHHRLGDLAAGLFRRRRDQHAADRQAGLFWALQDVTFSVGRGETLGIVGRNGAGKSTILKLLCGISKPTRGRVKTQGKVAALIEVGAGFHPDLTGRENVYLNGTILGLKRQQIRERFDQIVEFSEIGPFIDTPVKRYSSGMYVRLGFAIAVNVDPDVLLIDEVLSVGDLAFQQKCLQRIHEFKQMGKTMIFISHNLSAVQRICDRAILLEGGQVTAEGSVDTIIKRYRDQVAESERKRLTRAGQPAVAATGVRILDVRLRDPQGRPVETLAQGQPLVIEIDYAADRQVEQPQVWVGIDRLDGVICHVASLHQAERRPATLQGRGTLRVRYAALPLLANTYRVNVTISQQGLPYPLDQRQSAVFFTVTAEREARGVVHLDHQWEWEERSGSASAGS